MADQNKQIHIAPLVMKGQSFEQNHRVLTLTKAEAFYATLSDLKDQLFSKYVPGTSTPEVDTEKRDEVPSLTEGYKDISWMWIVDPSADNIGQGGHNPTFSKGIKQGLVRVSFPKFLEGGGVLWLEPFAEQPSGSVANGLFVRAIGTPEILGVEWTDLQGNNINSNEVNFGDTVLLKVYTVGLYWDDIIIQLKDLDYLSMVDDPDDLPAYERNGIGTPKAPIAAGQKTPPKVYKSLTRRVKYAKYRPSSKNNYASAINDYLGTLATDNENHYVQIAEVEIYIDEYWVEDGGNSLKIFPTINNRRINKEKAFQQDFVLVKNKKQVVQSKLTPTGNVPILVNDNEFNLAAFHHCLYRAITITLPDKTVDGKKVPSRPVTLFEENSEKPELLTIRDFEVIAGDTGNLKKITLDVVGVENAEADCVTTPIHLQKTIVIESHPEKDIKRHPKEPEDNRWKMEGNGSADIGIFKQEGKTTREVRWPVYPMNVYTNEGDDNKLIFDARFPYNRADIDMAGMGSLKLPFIFRYFWLSDAVAGTPYVVHVATCRYDNRVKVIPYPDVEWSLAFNFSDPEDGKKSRITLASDSIQTEKRHQPLRKWVSIGDRQFGIGLTAKFNGEDEREYSSDYVLKLKEKFKTLVKLIDNINNLFNPNNANASEEDKEKTRQFLERKKGQIAEREAQEKKDLGKQKELLKDAVRRYRGTDNDKQEEREKKTIRSRQRSIRRANAKLARTAIGFDIIWPNVEGGLSWKLVQTNDNQEEQYRNKVGLMFTGAVEFSPLLGASIYLDFLALVQRLHPIAYAIIAIADLTISQMGDGSKIIVELRGTGILGGKFEGFYNKLTGENSFNKEDRDENNMPVAKVTGDFTVSLKVHIKIAQKKNLIFVTVEGSGEVELEAVATWKARAAIDANDKGVYANIFGNFDGIKILGKGKVSGKVSGRRAADVPENNKDASTLGGSMGFNVEFEAMPKQEEELITTIQLGGN